MVSCEIAFRFRLLEAHGWRQPKHPHKANEPLTGPEYGAYGSKPGTGFASGVPQVTEYINMR
jgi:hypothetical protein